MGRGRAVALVGAVLVVASCAQGGVEQPAAAPAAAPVSAAVTSVQGAVWVANEDGDSVTVLDAATGEVQTTLTGVPSPHNVQTSPDGRSVWALSGAGRVLLLQAADARLTASALTDQHPAHVVGAPDGRVVVTSSGQASLYTYDERLFPQRRTAMEGAPHGVRLSGDGATAVVANTGAGTVDVIDTGTGAVRQRVTVGDRPIQVAVTDDGATAYASVASSSEVVRIDLATGAVTHRAAVPAAPAQVLLAAGRLLVANEGTDEAPGSTISVLDGDTLAPVGEVATGAGPHGLTADPTGRWVWVTNTDDATVTVVDLETFEAVATVDVGAGPGGISFTPVVLAGVKSSVALDVPGVDSHEPGEDHDH